MGQSEDVAAIMEHEGFDRIKIIKDLTGTDRGVMAFLTPAKNRQN